MKHSIIQVNFLAGVGYLLYCFSQNLSKQPKKSKSGVDAEGKSSYYMRR